MCEFAHAEVEEDAVAHACPSPSTSIPVHASKCPVQAPKCVERLLLLVNLEGSVRGLKSLLSELRRVSSAFSGISKPKLFGLISKLTASTCNGAGCAYVYKCVCVCVGS